jgi:hypothetical protein
MFAINVTCDPDLSMAWLLLSCLPCSCCAAHCNFCHAKCMKTTTSGARAGFHNVTVWRSAPNTQQTVVSNDTAALCQVDARIQPILHDCTPANTEMVASTLYAVFVTEKSQFQGRMRVRGERRGPDGWCAASRCSMQQQRIQDAATPPQHMAQQPGGSRNRRPPRAAG